MSVPRAKAKKHKHPIDKLNVNDVIRMTNYLNIAINCLAMCEKFDKPEDFREYIEGYKALLVEVQDKRASIGEMVSFASRQTGVDIVEMVRDVFGDLGDERKNY